MKFWTRLPGLNRWPPQAFAGPNWESQLGAKEFRQIAEWCDELGYDSLNVPEHLVMPTDLIPTMGAHWPDAFTVMSFVAGATSRIQVNSGIIALPLHHPVRLAKAVTTLDQLSGGRVMLTFGVGMAPGEFGALGVSFRRRGRIANEYIQAMKLLWQGGPQEFHGEFVDFEEVVLEPRPVQRPHPPVFFGGRSLHALRRAARYGDGWAPSGAQGGKGPWLTNVADLPGFLAQVDDEPGFAKHRAAFQIAMPAQPTNIDVHHRLVDPEPLTSTQQVIELVAELEEADVDWTTIPPLDPGPASLVEYHDYLAWAATEVMPLFR